MAIRHFSVNRSHPSSHFFLGVLAFLALSTSLLSTASAGEKPGDKLQPAVSEHQLLVRVIYAHNQRTHVDKELKKLVESFPKKDFSAFELRDHATFQMALHSRSRMQLPNKKWMSITALDVSAEGKIRIRLESKALKFKTVVSIAKGGTVAVGGPKFENGVLILAVTRNNNTK